jgi:hypothetical protein
MTEDVDNIMRLASLMATARVRRFAANSPNYKGPETEESTTKMVDEATAALRKAVEELAFTVP